MSSIKRILRQNEISFGYRIGYLFNHFAGPVYKASSAELGIQRPEFAALFCTAHLSAATATDVVTLTGIPKNSISRAVARLIGSGLLVRSAHKTDGRRAILEMTCDGRRIYESILPLFKARQDGMMDVLTVAERAEFSRLLNKLVERDDEWAQDT